MRINFISCFGISFLFLGLSLISIGQKLPQFPEQLASPLSIPLSLSGSFGEMRVNHYHTGWDLQTGEKQGIQVHAIADGYISRVRISSKGYGYSLYVTHPALGITSVYAHLSAFYSEVKNWTEDQQYLTKKNEFDWTLSPEQFVVKRGQIIALSGNSGSSGGPHLHFEIRNTVTEKTIDPALLGYKIPDVTRPLIESVSFIPKGDFLPAEVIPFRFNGESLGKDSLFEVVDTFGVAVQVYDWVLDADHACGIKQILTLWDGNIVSEWIADSLDFKEVKHVNAQCMFGVKERHTRTTYRTYQLPNSPGTGFLYIEKSGWMTIRDTMTHAVTIMVSDFSGNATCVYAFVKRKKNLPSDDAKSEKQVFDWWTGGTIAQGDWCLRIPKDALYEETPLTLTNFSSIEKSDSMLMKISIEPKSIFFKNVILLENRDSDWWLKSAEERMKYGWMEVRKNDEWYPWDEEKKAYPFSHTGNYRLIKDTTSPKVINSASFVEDNFLLIEESESGLKSYSAYFGEQWLLLYWDAKNDKMLIDPNWREKWDGKSQLHLELADKSGNVSQIWLEVK
jgi:hypothetical protein